MHNTYIYIYTHTYTYNTNNTNDAVALLQEHGSLAPRPDEEAPVVYSI